jgi:phospholipid-translocating ATPase
MHIFVLLASLKLKHLNLFFLYIRIGIVYEGEEKAKNSDIIRVVNFMNKKRYYQLLQVLEFDSTRKRMSVILRDMQTQRIVLFCKGAETAIFKNCTKGRVDLCDADIKKFAEQGWRTLALSYKYMSENEYKTIENMLADAYNDIIKREEKMALAFDKIESNLELIAATAVEDKLQEDVADTLEKIRQAGIKIWVLTGDKRETAINISNSCKHFSPDMTKLIISDLKNGQEIRNRLNKFKTE